MLKIIESNEYNNKLIEMSKSSSKVSGLKLRETHYQIGKEIAKAILNSHEDKFFSVLIVMRAGLFIGLGIANQLDFAGRLSNISFEYENKQQLYPTIIVDAVIHTGNTIKKLLSSIPSKKIIATSVISSKAVDLFSNHNLFTMRVSKNHYKGSYETTIIDGKGPDTGERLFNSFFFSKK
ncbi:MAG TPA: phosphoribosyl transferase [Gallicola sp.]|nr:phosphoribosyl transferase [Gallicola sp.]